MNIRFDENGLVPVIIQHATTKEVLTLAYMNEQSYEKTIETKETWLYSRSRQELWHKGATSGNTQQVVALSVDCDNDALLLEVLPKGPACHTGERTCFHKNSIEKDTRVPSLDIIEKLRDLIENRQKEMPEGAYTTYLFEKGVEKISKKIGEEATEVVIAAMKNDAEELKTESADLLYHLFVMLQHKNVDIYDVLSVLQQRHDKQ